MAESMEQRRRRLLGPSLPTFYRNPVHAVRAKGVWLWDADGKQYLDCYNNVPHVGHCHPKVVEAITRQAKTLNTHTRYLSNLILDYVERLTGKLSADLQQAVLTCTGSEANDLAIRMAQRFTGNAGIIATDNTYHGNTALVSQLSSRHDPVGGRLGHIKRVPAPESASLSGEGVDTRHEAFAQHVQAAIDDLNEEGFGVGCFLFCPYFANEGFPSVERGFLDLAAGRVRGAGGILIADEVQPGFGRTGSHWWGHERIGVAPEIVTMGKPMANGHPVAAIVTRPDIMAAFRDTASYFNTFGGNPVSCAAALATLEVIEEESLVENARAVGEFMMDELGKLEHPLIAEARGSGFFLGIEFQKDGEPASGFVTEVVEEMRNRGILLGKTGRAGAVLKIRPPMPFSMENASQLVETLGAALKAVGDSDGD